METEAAVLISKGGAVGLHLSGTVGLRLGIGMQLADVVGEGVVSFAFCGAR